MHQKSFVKTVVFKSKLKKGWPLPSAGNDVKTNHSGLLGCRSGAYCYCLGSLLLGVETTVSSRTLQECLESDTNTNRVNTVHCEPVNRDHFVLRCLLCSFGHRREITLLVQFLPEPCFMTGTATANADPWIILKKPDNEPTGTSCEKKKRKKTDRHMQLNARWSLYFADNVACAFLYSAQVCAPNGYTVFRHGICARSF